LLPDKRINFGFQAVDPVQNPIDVVVNIHLRHIFLGYLFPCPVQENL